MSSLSEVEDQVLHNAFQHYFPTMKDYKTFFEEQLPIDDVECWPERLAVAVTKVKNELGDALTENIDTYLQDMLISATKVCVMPRLALYGRAALLFLADKGIKVGWILPSTDCPDQSTMELYTDAALHVITTDIKEYTKDVFGEGDDTLPTAGQPHPQACEEVRAYFEEHHPYIKNSPLFFEDEGSCTIL